jgi:SAM-dependent methyltransferase
MCLKNVTLIDIGPREAYNGFMPDTLPCKLCGQDAVYRFERPLDGGLRGRYFECPACGLLQSPHLDALTPEALARLYAPSPHPLDPGGAWRQFCVAARLSALLRLGAIPSVPGVRLRVLDLGCGNGWVAGYLAFHHGCDAAGYDPHAPPAAAPVPLHRDWTDAARGGPYDLIVAAEVFEHFIRVREEVDRIAAVLAPRGCVYLTTGLYEPARCGADWDYLGQSGQHVAFYARATHARIAGGMGARAVRCGAPYEWLYTRVPGLRPVLASLALRAGLAAGLQPRIV